MIGVFCAAATGCGLQLAQNRASSSQKNCTLPQLAFREKMTMADLFENPLGTRGFAFVEYTAAGDTLSQLQALFTQMGFAAIARHKSKPVTLWQQGEVRFLINEMADGQAKAFRDAHDAGANAMGFLMDDASAALPKATSRGAVAVASGLWSDRLGAIEGIGGSVIYFVTQTELKAQLDAEFDFDADAPQGAGLLMVDHLTHNVMRGNMNKWAGFYEAVFNFREIRYFDIEGKLTGLLSKAMTSPDGFIRIPLNESRDDKSQIEEFLRRYKGEGIQHIALSTGNIYETVETLRTRGVPFQATPDTYFEGVNTRIPGHGEDLARLHKNNILIDGAPGDTGLLLQIFTQDAIGPIFFEIIQRKGNEGFGEGNFQALFESIELDQIRRGVLSEDA
jgi:4-hydroxyphenylpyruvate dioxygenase